MNISEIKKMTANEKLQAIEALWDSLLSDEPYQSSPDWNEDILKDRANKINSGNSEFISLGELKKNNK